MEVKKYNLFTVKPKTKPETKPFPKAKTKPKPKTKLEARGWVTKGEAPFSLENKKKLDTFYAKCFVKTSKK